MLQFSVQIVYPFKGNLNTVDAYSYREAAKKHIKLAYQVGVRKARERAEKTGELVCASTNIWYADRVSVRVGRAEYRTFTFKPELVEIS